jgi:hypothetical protein
LVLRIRFPFFRPRLFDKVAKAAGPLAFIDESFQAPNQNPDSFYLITAAVIPKDKVLEVRKQLRFLARGASWHTTESARSEAGRLQIQQLASYLARHCKPVIVVIDQIPESDRNAEAARAQAIRALLIELAQQHMYLTGTVVYEKRIPGYMQTHDEMIFNAIASGQNDANRLNVIGLSTKKEPLLWAPDIICWAYRQAYMGRNTTFFDELAKVASVIHLGQVGQKSTQSH